MDEALAMADVDAAVAKDANHVFYCYTPNHMFALYDLVILGEPAYDASKWTIIQPTDDPEWLEKSSAPVAWDLAYLHVHYAASLEESASGSRRPAEQGQADHRPSVPYDIRPRC